MDEQQWKSWLYAAFEQPYKDRVAYSNRSGWESSARGMKEGIRTTIDVLGEVDITQPEPEVLRQAVTLLRAREVTYREADYDHDGWGISVLMHVLRWFERKQQEYEIESSG